MIVILIGTLFELMFLIGITLSMDSSSQVDGFGNRRSHTTSLVETNDDPIQDHDFKSKS